VNAARRTLGCWLLAAFLERGCDSSQMRLPQRVPRIRYLTAAELASIHRLPVPLVPLHNLLRMPRPRHALCATPAD
jgi:hypothetical protein